MPKQLLAALLAIGVMSCTEEQGTTGAAASATATSRAALSAPAPSAKAAAPAPSASTPPHDCLEGTTGEGSLSKPCEAKGAARIMTVTWTGKLTDTGPSFRVTNTSKLVVLYGRVVVYFYDKAGKQLEVVSGKARPNQACAGNLFSGVMNAGEKAVLTFSCVDKTHVPDGTAHIEAEMQTVGFADPSGKKSEFYWRNNDLVPDTRPKGGVK